MGPDKHGLGPLRRRGIFQRGDARHTPRAQRQGRSACGSPRPTVPLVVERNTGVPLPQHPGASQELGAKGAFHLLQLILHNVKQAAAVFLHQALEESFVTQPYAEEGETDAAAGPQDGRRAVGGLGRGPSPAGLLRGGRGNPQVEGGESRGVAGRGGRRRVFPGGGSDDGSAGSQRFRVGGRRGDRACGGGEDEGRLGEQGGRVELQGEAGTDVWTCRAGRDRGGFGPGAPALPRRARDGGRPLPTAGGDSGGRALTGAAGRAGRAGGAGGGCGSGGRRRGARGCGRGGPAWAAGRRCSTASPPPPPPPPRRPVPGGAASPTAPRTRPRSRAASSSSDPWRRRPRTGTGTGRRAPSAPPPLPSSGPLRRGDRPLWRGTGPAPCPTPERGRTAFPGSGESFRQPRPPASSTGEPSPLRPARDGAREKRRPWKLGRVAELSETPKGPTESRARNPATARPPVPGERVGKRGRYPFSLPCSFCLDKNAPECRETAFSLPLEAERMRKRTAGRAPSSLPGASRSVSARRQTWPCAAGSTRPHTARLVSSISITAN